MSNVMNKGTAIVGFVLSFVTGAGFMYAVDSKANKDTSGASADKAGGGLGGGPGGAWKQDGPIPLSNADPVDGKVEAQVTIVEFSDFQCPYCSRVGPTIKQLKTDYGDKIRIVWKDLPLDFHKNAMPAATAARVVFMAKGNEAFWKMNEKLFAGQSQLSDESYKKWAAELGVTAADFEKYGKDAEAKVKQNLADAQKLGIQGTPNFMIDGEALTGAQPVDKFKAVIDAHLKKAAELKGKGTADNQLYVELTKSYFQQPKAPEAPQEEPDDPTVWKVELGDAPIKVGTGADPSKKAALVTIVTFSDFQCPFCKRVEPALAQVAKEYGDKVAFVWKDDPLPFHNRAQQAAMVAIEARKEKGDAGFWKAHDKLFDIQPKLEDADLEAAAKELGLDVGKTMAAVKGLTYKDVLDKSVAQAGDLHVEGTPHSFVNGRVVNGAQPFEKFKKIIDQELAKAQAKVAAGTKLEDVYAETIKGGKGGPLPPLAIPATAPWKGGRDAKVVVQVFSEFQCPFCKRAEVPMPGQDGKIDPNGAGMLAATTKYGDKIKVVWRNFPLSFHDRAEPAAEFAIEAFKQKGNDGFWKAHDALFESQPKLADADLQAIATKIGVDWAKAKDAIDSHKYKAEIDKDTAEGGSVGVTGTPGFFISPAGKPGKLLVGAQPADAFYAAIDAALAQAK
jgi:protein-disulfide isomerase